MGIHNGNAIYVNGAADAEKAATQLYDLVREDLVSEDLDDLIELSSEYPDLSLLLEYGVAQQTQISLITAGLSRTSTIVLSELIASDSLSPDAVRKWLIDNARLWRESALSPLVKREVQRLLPEGSLN